METNCAKCFLSMLAATAAGRGREERPIACFINDTTTVSDIKHNHPFSGKSNKVLLEFANAYDLKDVCYFTNLIKCRLDVPTDYYAQKCLPMLINELNKIKPLIIVTCGKFVYKTLTDKHNIPMKSVIHKFTKFGNSLLLPTYSPTYIHKNGLYEEYNKLFNILGTIYKTKNRYYELPTYVR